MTEADIILAALILAVFALVNQNESACTTTTKRNEPVAALEKISAEDDAEPIVMEE